MTPLLDKPLTPDPELARCYDRLFPIYQAARQASGPLWQAMRDMRDALAEPVTAG